MSKSKDLIKLVDEERAVSLKNQGELKSVLNTPVPKDWVKPHPLAKNVEYLPIDKVENLLDAIFQEWKVEIKSVFQLAQSVCCIVRLHYKNPLSGEWQFQDGVGATPLKTDKGFTAADLSHIKSDAVQTGAPAAESFAIKDAAEHLGKLFGRDLNRKDTTYLAGLYGQPNTNEDQEIQSAIRSLETADSMVKLQQIWVGLGAKIRLNKEVIAKKDELKERFNNESSTNPAK